MDDPSIGPVEFIGEKRGLDSLYYYEYERYDPDPGEEDWINAHGTYRFFG